jgi:hypothetical protein
MIDLFTNTPIFALVLWCALYISDYYLTIYAARMYQGGAKERIAFAGSYELTPYYQNDVNALRMWSPRFLAMLAFTCAIIVFLWFVSVSFFHVAELYWFALGILILREGAIHIRHVRNIALFRLIQNDGAVQGQIAYARWVTLKSSAMEMFAFTGLFAMLAALLGSWFMFGGTLGCLTIGLRHLQYARTAMKIK